MATLFQNRRNRLLAVLLALIAAGSLCVIAVSAAGYAISSPAWDAVVAFFRGEGPTTGGPLTGGPGTGGPGSGPGPGDTNGGGPNGGGPNGGGDSGNESCLLGLLCISADVDASGGGAGSGSGGCLLNLICLSAEGEVGGSGASSPAIKVDANVDDSGPAAKADAGESTILDLGPNSVTAPLVPNVTGGEGNGCLLGVVCLNLGGN